MLPIRSNFSVLFSLFLLKKASAHWGGGWIEVGGKITVSLQLELKIMLKYTIIKLSNLFDDKNRDLSCKQIIKIIGGGDANDSKKISYGCSACIYVSHWFNFCNAGVWIGRAADCVFVKLNLPDGGGL